MKLPIYFEAFGTIGITVTFVAKTKRADEPHHGTVTMLLAECPDEMRAAVNANYAEHSKTKNTGYELTKTGYVVSEPIKV